MTKKYYKKLTMEINNNKEVEKQYIEKLRGYYDKAGRYKEHN